MGITRSGLARRIADAVWAVAIGNRNVNNVQGNVQGDIQGDLLGNLPGSIGTILNPDSIRQVQRVSVTYSLNTGDGDGFIEVALGIAIVDDEKCFFTSQGGHSNTSTGGQPTAPTPAIPVWEIVNSTTVRAVFASQAVNGSGSGGAQFTWAADFVEGY